ncbi:hypothetical protein GEMRC1_005273 [Eukaryota sp. GEM-RC1]
MILLESLSSSTKNGIIQSLMATNLDDPFLALMNVAVCLLFSLMSSFHLISDAITRVRYEDLFKDHLKCLESFSTIFSYRWDYTAESDVDYVRNKIENNLQKSSNHRKWSKTLKKDSKALKWDDYVLLYALSLLLVGVLLLVLTILRNVFFFYLFSSGHPLAYLDSLLLICLFNFLGRKMLYSITSSLPIPERDSFRLWCLLFLKLCFFSIPLLFVVGESSCFPTDFGLYIFQLLILTFFFDVIFPFFWYKFRSLSKSFEKPLFDLPLSQAKVSYYHVLSFTAQFYVPTFALVSLPLVYLYGKYLSYSLRKCSRLPSATYNVDHWKSCFLKSGIISFPICSSSLLFQ